MSVEELLEALINYGIAFDMVEVGLIKMEAVVVAEELVVNVVEVGFADVVGVVVEEYINLT